MSNFSDKDIDRLSREAAESFQPDDSDFSWSSLERKLSEQMPERPPDNVRFRRGSPWVWGPGLILLTGLSIFFIKNGLYSKHSTPIVQLNGKDKTEGRIIKERSNPMSDSGESVAGAVKSLTANTPENQRNDEKAGEEKITNEIQYESSLRPAYSTQRSGIRNNKSGKTKPGSVSGTGKNNRNSIPVTGAFLSSESSLSGGSNSGKTKSSLQTESSDNSFQRAGPGLPSLSHVNLVPGKIQGNDSLLNALAQTSASTPSKSLRINRSLNFGITFGPEFTHASKIPNNQFGNNIGVTVGYYLTNKLSINSGLIYSNKFYWSQGQNQRIITVAAAYAPGPIQGGNIALFAAAPAVEYINSAANIWEIPLTLRYDFAENRKTKFFANAGVSSFFMMKQTSIYFSHSGQRALAWKKVDSEQSNYWFDVANVSLGIETDLGKGFSFQMEPFMQLPFKRMGSENLKLNSYGVLLSIRFAPVLSRQKK